MLKTSLLCECSRVYQGNDFVFMQDSTPSHCAWETQRFVRQNTPDFIAADEWASYSPNINHLDYCIWDFLKDLVNKGRRLPFANLRDLNEAIKNKWKEVTIETVRKSIAQWKKRLNAVRKQNGGAIQHIFRCDWISISCREACWTYSLFCMFHTTTIYKSPIYNIKR